MSFVIVSDKPNEPEEPRMPDWGISPMSLISRMSRGWYRLGG